MAVQPARAPSSEALAGGTAFDPEARRLLWRCRRGMKELDVLLERFARRELPVFSVEERNTFARFLELPDPVLIDYLLGQTIPPEPDLAQLARRITVPAAGDPVATPAPLPTVTHATDPGGPCGLQGLRRPQGPSD